MTTDGESDRLGLGGSGLGCGCLCGGDALGWGAGFSDTSGGTDEPLHAWGVPRPLMTDTNTNTTTTENDR